MATVLRASKDEFALFLTVDPETATYKMERTNVIAWRIDDGSDVATPIVTGTRGGKPAATLAVCISEGRYSIDGVIVTSLRQWVIQELARYEAALPAEMRKGLGAYREVFPGFWLGDGNGDYVHYSSTRFLPTHAEIELLAGVEASTELNPATFRPAAEFDAAVFRPNAPAIVPKPRAAAKPSTPGRTATR